MTDMRRFIERMPKAELHVHVEGTLEPEMKFDLARRNGIQLPYRSVDEMRAAYDFDDLPSFLKMYYEGMSVLRTEQDFYDLTTAYLTKAHSQNVVYAEMFFDPQAHAVRGIDYDTVIRGIRRAQVDAEDKLGIRTQLIMCFLRDMSADSAMATLEQSLPYKNWIIGVGLDSDEKGNPPIKFKDVFDRARAEGYRLTMHCDVDQENSTRHIWQTLDDIGVDRIDHGVNSLEDEALCDEIMRRGLALTVCPISNKCITGSLKALEVRRMLEKGMRATVNSDDPAYFLGYVQENLVATQEEADLSAGSGRPACRQRLRGELAAGGGAAWPARPTGGLCGVGGGSLTMPHSDHALATRFLDVIEQDIVPLTRAGVARGDKVFGGAILRKSDLSLVIAATNRETENPLYHGEISTLNAFFALPGEARPPPEDCLFLSTHEPCSLCLSAITWAGFDNFHYLFGYVDTRDAFNIPHDLRILSEVFRIENGDYARENAFWRCRSVDELIGIKSEHLKERIRRLQALYDELSSVYQGSKDDNDIPLR